MSGATDPVEALLRLAPAGAGRGALLLESGDLHAPEGRRTLLVPAPVLRIRLMDESLQVDPLDVRGDALIGVLAELWNAPALDRGSLAIGFPVATFDPALTDRERLLAPSCFDRLREILGLVVDTDPAPGPPVGLYGAFGFELMDRFERLPARRPDPLHEPDLNLVLTLDGIVFDYETDEVCAVTRNLALPDGSPLGPQDAPRRLAAMGSALGTGDGPRPVITEERLTLPAATPDMSDQDYKDGVTLLLDHIAAGDVFQTVLSRGLRVPSPADPIDVYRHLRNRNPSPYMFHFDLGDGTLLGASPETCVRCEDRNLMLSPIAGTVARGFLADGSADRDRDARLAVGLLLDQKEQSEHAMLIDLARNDVARISVPGTREVEQPFSVERFSHVQHLVSRVVGQLAPDLDALDAYRACANMGTLTGAPKLKAVELIRNLEATGRGFYGGALGYITREGDLDTCIVIRSLRHKDGVYHARAGAGVVGDSIPDRELQETRDKARAPLLAIAQAEGRTS